MSKVPTWKMAISAGTLALATGAGLFHMSQVDTSEAAELPLSTLENIPGFRFVNGGLDEALFRTEELAREYLIVECMAASGWKYVAAPSMVVESDESGPAEEYVDPNEEITAAFSADELEDYYLALYGTSSPNELVQEENTDNGCLQKAHAEIPGVFELASQLTGEIDALEVAIAADPELKDAEDAWAACVAEGHAKKSCDSALKNAKRTVAVKHENAFAIAHKMQIEDFKAKHALAYAKSLEIVNRHQ